MSEPILNHNVTDIGPISRERILAAIERAEEKFWAEISQSFPEITHGDVSPEWVFQREHDNNRAVTTWIDGNLDPHLLPFDGDVDDIEALIWGAEHSLGVPIVQVDQGQAGGTVMFRVELADGRYLAVGDLQDPFCPRWSDGGIVENDGWSASLYANLHAYENDAKDSVFRTTEDKTPNGLQKLLRDITAN